VRDLPAIGDNDLGFLDQLALLLEGTRRSVAVPMFRTSVDPAIKIIMT
jgi:hypothetical protein